MNVSILILSFLFLLNSCKQVEVYKHESKGFFKIENHQISPSITRGKSIVIGRVYSQYEKRHVSYGSVELTNREGVGSLIDSLGKFSLLLNAGNIDLKIQNVGNSDFYIDSLVITQNTIYTLEIYLGTYVISDRN